MARRKPRKCDVVELAVWFHETAMKSEYMKSDPRPGLPFYQLSKGRQDTYKFVAEKLLANPPAFMKVRK